MSVMDVLTRAETMCSKYEKYLDTTPLLVSTGDGFLDAYNVLLERVQDLQLKHDEASTEKNRALRATLNAEVRREKANILEQALPRLAQSASSLRKGSTPEEDADRTTKVADLTRTVLDIGAAPGEAARFAAQAGLGAMTTSGLVAGEEITINPLGMDANTMDRSAYEETEETRAFQTEAQRARQQQDAALARIEQGLGTLKELGLAMGEEVDRHDVLIDQATAQMEHVTRGLASNNARLAKVMEKVGSFKNFIIDIVLVCLLLGLGVYLYMMLK